MGNASFTGKAELFFSDDKDETAVARGLCRRCPVKAECFVFPWRAKEHHGIWGGQYEISIARGEATRPL